MVIALLLSAVVTPVPAAATPGGIDCAYPAAGAAFESRSAAQVGMDGAAVADAIDFGMSTGANTVQVYRHGCLVDGRAQFGDAPLPLASASKGVAAVAVGRAITLGYFDVDDTLGTFFPEADAEHAALTIRQVLNQTTGLRFTWPSDGAGVVTDQISQTLHAPVDYPAGTTFQYAQNVLAVLPEIIARTTGRDFLEFVQQELFDPLGIARDHWVWVRDRSGNVAINGGLAMRPADLARLGQLLLRNGSWADRQLIDPEYIREGSTGTEANEAYGFLWWTNSGETYRSAGAPIPEVIDQPFWVGSPRDMYMFSGAFGQFVVVVPSRDMVIVRLGGPSRNDPATVAGILTGTTNPDFKELFRRLTAAVTDVPPEPYDDPYRYPVRNEPLARTPEDLDRLIDPANTIAILLGTGPYSDSGCNLAVCHGSPLGADIQRFTADVADQVAAAAAAGAGTGRADTAGDAPG
ncbi:serine hydrolase domain-containing protein [Millisia brevis]|uniref:serine hydrolase domain-containing protein n=1 Tax=Millisia brevis TaxID=264148 RepID=UPI000833466B|nr:serine hydrolase [Millisia brevis]